MKSKEECRIVVDRAIVALWCALRDLSDHSLINRKDCDDDYIMPSEDLLLFGRVSVHSAVQNKLQESIDTERRDNYNRFID